LKPGIIVGVVASRPEDEPLLDPELEPPEVDPSSPASVASSFVWFRAFPPHAAARAAPTEMQQNTLTSFIGVVLPQL
jgi:hypothetical protein